MEIGKEIIMSKSVPKNWVYICSPYKDNPAENTELAKRICKIAARLRYVPIAPHLYFTQFLDEESYRWLGIESGLNLVGLCSELWVIGDNITEGMSEEIMAAKSSNIPIKFVPATLSMWEPPISEPFVPTPMEVIVKNTDPVPVVGKMEHSL